jgi:hypothetical protein
MIRRTLLAVLCVASATISAPRLTTIQDLLYKADGTPFNGILTISWGGFQSADGSTIMTQSTTVKVIDGILRVQLAPSPTSPASYYTVTYNSDGYIQFQETWLVPASNVPVRVRDVRTTASTTVGGLTGSTGSSIQESDVVGLVADLGARPLKGASMSAGRVAFVNSLGAIDSVSGNASDCLHVDGSSGACGSSSTSFVDGDSLSGIVDGANTTFLLSNTPNPATSLAVYRNGMLQKAGFDYNANANSVVFVTVDAPQPGDTLLASYRLGGSSGGSLSYPQPQVLCTGTGTSTTGTSMVSLGACAIPAGLLAAGDRVEIHFDLAHAGTASGFTFEVDWQTTPILNRTGANSDALVSGRGEAAVLAAGAQLSAQSWGTVLPLSASVAAAGDAYATGVIINFQGALTQGADTLGLAHYTVVRLP